jgi:hypothetical protein
VGTLVVSPTSFSPDQRVATLRTLAELV